MPRTWFPNWMQVSRKFNFIVYGKALRANYQNAHALNRTLANEFASSSTTALQKRLPLRANQGFSYIMRTLSFSKFELVYELEKSTAIPSRRRWQTIQQAELLLNWGRLRGVLIEKRFELLSRGCQKE